MIITVILIITTQHIQSWFLDIISPFQTIFPLFLFCNITEQILHNYLNNCIFPCNTFTLILNIIDKDLFYYCYKTRVQTDFRVRVRTENRYRHQYYYQSTMEEGHMTWKLYEIMLQAQSVKIVDGRLYFIFSFYFILLYFYFYFLFFLFLEQLGLGFISHAVTSVTN